MYYGYHRTSTKEQHLDRGIKGIQDFCKVRNYPLEKIYTDQCSGKNIDRPRYIVLKEDVLRTGDTLIIYELDRLARDKKLIAQELEYFDKRGIRVMILNIPTTTIDLADVPDSVYRMVIDTVNHLIMEVYSMQAQTEMEQRAKRQAEGIQAKKDRGEWDKYGRPRKLSKEEFREWYNHVLSGELTSAALRRSLNLSNTTYFRYLRELKESLHQE